MGLPTRVVAFAGYHHGRGPREQLGRSTWDLFEGLSVELEERYGRYALVGGDPFWRLWRASARELVELRVTWGGALIEEAHYFLDDVPLVAMRQLPTSSSEPSWPSGPRE